MKPAPCAAATYPWAMKSIWARLRQTFVIRVVLCYLSHNGPNQATLISWNLLFAIFPIVILAVTLAAVALNDPAAGRAVANAVASLLPEGRGSAVIQALDTFHRDSGWLAIVGVVGLIWSGTSLFGAMDQAFAAISDGKPRSFLPQKLMSVAMIVLFTILAVPIVLSSSLLAVLESLPQVPTWLHSGPLALLLQALTASLVGTVLFGAIYGLVPHQRPQLPALLRGAATSGVLFEVLSLAFPLYFHLERGFSSYGSTFGLFFVILAYAFLVAQITVLGYAVAVVADAPDGPRDRVRASQPSPAPEPTGP